MGVLSGKDIFNSKFITAEISDASGRLWFVPIKNVLGDYFVTELNNKTYCFKIDARRKKIYRHSFVKSFSVLHYTTAHAYPISHEDCKELENILAKNGLPRVNILLFNIMKYISRREKSPEIKFTPHEIPKIMKTLSKMQEQYINKQLKNRSTTPHEDHYAAQAESMLSFLQHLDISKIVTPLKPVVDFIEDDLIRTDPGFYGDVITFYKRTDIEHHRMNNEPLTGKKPWMKWIAILSLIAVFGVIGYMVYDSGAIQSMLPDFSQMQSLDLSQAMPGMGSAPNIMEQYPDPLDLKLAIDRGEVNYNTLPDPVKKMVDNVKLPQAHSVKLGE